jgi:hypothetical protein
MKYLTFPRSSVLVLGSNSIESLLPSTLISQVDGLLKSHRIEDAINLADQQRTKLQGKAGAAAADEEEVSRRVCLMMAYWKRCGHVLQTDELRYVYQRIGFQCLSETLFEDAGQNLFAGDLDPRVLVSYFPELRGSLFSSTSTIDLFAGVVEHMPLDSSVDDISKFFVCLRFSTRICSSSTSLPIDACPRRN